MTSDRCAQVLKMLITTALLGFCSVTAHAQAQKVLMTIESSGMQPPILIGRPNLTWWDVKIPGTAGLMVGRLKFDMHLENYHFATLETDELTLNGPEQRIRVLLPPIHSVNTVDQLQVDISFAGKKFSGSLGSKILRIPFANKVVFMGLVGESRLAPGRSADRDVVLSQLKLERLIGGGHTNNNEDEDERLKTVLPSIDPADLPADAMLYCGYDLVALMGNELHRLNKQQTEALLTWVKAGGSLYVEPTGVLERIHLEFLQNLVAGGRPDLVFQLDKVGKLISAVDPGQSPMISVQCGLGDVVIRDVDRSETESISSKEWAEVSQRLWKIRKAPVQHQSFDQTIIGADRRPRTVTRPNPDPYGLATASANRFRLDQTTLLERLMPEGVRTVPLWILATVLIGFVAVIGPGDYLVLGMMRARKFTWITFPIAAILTTWITILISNAYMSASETRKSLILRDLGDQGEVVRTNQIELLYTASNHQVRLEMEREIFAPLDTNTNRVDPFTQRPQGRRGLEGQDAAVSFQGRIPNQFVAMQNLTKWTPQMNRIMSIPGTSASLQVDWSELTLTPLDVNDIRNRKIPDVVRNFVSTKFGPDASAACITQTDGWAYDRSANWFASGNRLAENGLAVDHNLLYYDPAFDGNGTIARVQHEAEVFQWLYIASVSPTDPGKFAFTRATAPKGGAFCEDLLILDSTDPDTCLICVVVPQGNDLIVYRKLVRVK